MASVRRAFTLWPFSRAKNAASNRKITANPLKLPGVTAKSADSFCAIGVPFNNKSREKAIIISTARTRLVRLNHEFGCPMNDCEYARKSLRLRKQRDKQKAVGFAEKNRIRFNADCVSVIFNP
jgi:hypothetical protein